ncbi:hypothetical protein GCM10010971_17510 [Silvimonas amylolytica]|uniref:Uncharacterized protein n=1 Tax=Silvimonas amylolytica TaxID=449663 RepID=A0ABQ2PK00_9NEIS|nr:hypothetical protein GCM10010971_17510 [Silvimonas amylolytica]
MAQRYGLPGVAKRIVAKGLAGQPGGEPGTDHAMKQGFKFVDVTSSLTGISLQEDSYSPMTTERIVHRLSHQATV